MACPILYVSSDITGLSFAEEDCAGQLPATPTFYQLEPNSYSDFGGQYTTVTRMPINPSRQRKKGGVTDLDATGGFNQDMTFNNVTRLLQGFFFADIREKTTTYPMNGLNVEFATVDTNEFLSSAARTTSFLPNDLVYTSGFSMTNNNGLFTVVSDDGTTVTVSEPTSTETVISATARMDCVGFKIAPDDAEVIIDNGIPTLKTTTTDLSTHNLIPGEWIYLGGDSPSSRFDINFGYARVQSVTQYAIVFDKTQWDPVAEVGTGKSIYLFCGDVLKNENDRSLIKRRTYTLERTLGEDDSGEVQSEILTGAVPNQMTVNVNQADKITIDFTFVALDHLQRTGADGLLPGLRMSFDVEDFINTSTDVIRQNISVIDNTNSYVKPLFAFTTASTIVVNNNVTPLKAVSKLGAFETNPGIFTVTGTLNCYFADVRATQAVRKNADVTVDYVYASKNKGIIFDMGLVTLGDGRLNVTAGEAIQLNLDQDAVQNKNNNTLLYMNFSYLPNIAM